ncbi:MAG: NUDIX domain-containing protein [Candidatus Micrarchaeia archaeon]
MNNEKIAKKQEDTHELPNLKSLGRVARTGKGFLCFIFANNSVLLEKSGAAWLAPNGDIADGESPEHAAATKVYEQTGIIVNALEPVGEVLVAYAKSSESNRHMFVFVSQDFSGSEKNGSTLRWFEKSNMPVKEIPEAHKILLQLVMSGKRFSGELYLEEGSNGTGKLIKYDMKEM